MKNNSRLLLPFAACCALGVLPSAGWTQDKAAPASAKGAPLTEVAKFDTYQVTGVTVSKTGRIFVNFPRWSNDYKYAVTEVMPDGSSKPYPDEEWNSWKTGDAPSPKKFICVQSVVVDDSDSLWVLDPASPGQNGVEPGQAKLVKFDLKENKAVQTIPFGSDIAPAKSYLNDVRIDVDRQVAYITESGMGAIVVVDLKTGKARRALDQDDSVMLEKGIDLTINGKEVMTAEGKKPQFQVDGLALSPDNEYLYYQALMGGTLYRIKTAVLRDPNASKSEQSKAVEKVAQTFPVDGLWMDKKGNLYLSDLRSGAIQRRNPDGKIELMAADPRIQWPDTFAEGPDGAIYFTTSHIHHMARFNGGKEARTMPYGLFKFTPPQN
jgi:sugar lactone lactonase YvrE